MIVGGILAAIAVPAVAAQRRKADEATTKSDIRGVAKEVLALYADGSGPFAVTGSNGTWTISDAHGVLATAGLSPHNEVSPASFVTVGGDYCLSIRNARVGAQYWAADDVGLRIGDCSATP